MDPAAFEHDLATRYASRAMVAIFSQKNRIGIWRRIWQALASAERDLGLPVSQAQLDALAKHLDDADLARAAELEKKLRHDVMAHVHLLKEQCPEAGPILHLGATSCDVTDNADLIVMRRALELVARKLRAVIRNLRALADREKGRPCVAFTHFQPAQFTTVGKRAALWLQDFLQDHEELAFVLGSLRFRGLKGATGTQDSFLKLFDGDARKVRDLERAFAARLGFESTFPVTGQTYPRKQDARVLNALSAIAQSAQKMAGDVRLLAHENEVEEPFEESQIGSSAMAYKRNPMRSERMASLARFLIVLSQNPAHTAGQQWLERTLDDSANRRLSLSEGFLAADAILDLALNVTGRLEVRAAVIDRHAREQLPLIATEEILMEGVKRGGDRQELHEAIRKVSIEALERVKAGAPNDLLERARRHPLLGPAAAAVEGRLSPERYVGLCVDQVTRFLADHVDPVLARFADERVVDEVRV
jgi:adenylosuccinate lyase